LVVGSVIAAALVILLAAGMLLRGGWGNDQPQIGQRELVPGLGYCTADQMRPCILSFSLDTAGKMVIQIETQSAVSPAFYLKIRREETENVYGCQKAGGFSRTFSCSGKAMPAGEMLQFLMFSRQNDALLAEGKFPIIGLALATPQPATTPTPVPVLEHPPR
jgi:hypothetical protein